MNWLRNGGADVLVVAVVIAILAVAGIQAARRIRQTRTAPEPESELSVAIGILYRTAADKRLGKWLVWPLGGSDHRLRLTEIPDGYLIEQVCLANWPPTAGADIRVTCMVVQHTKDFVCRYELHVRAGDRGVIPCPLDVEDPELRVVGDLYAVAEASVREIIRWMEHVNEASLP